MTFLKIAGFVATPFLGNGVGYFFNEKTTKKMPVAPQNIQLVRKVWYDDELDKPNWRPPNWLFPPVWSILYASMGYASYLVYRDGQGDARNLALSLYATNLALNWAWSIIFFKKHKIGLAAIEIVLLALNIGACIWSFYPINKTASYLMVPYLAWVSFASCLSFSIWNRNKHKKID